MGAHANNLSRGRASPASIKTVSGTEWAPPSWLVSALFLSLRPFPTMEIQPFWHDCQRQAGPCPMEWWEMSDPS